MITSRTQLIELLKQFNLPLIAAEVGVAEGIFSRELLDLGIEKLYLIDIWKSVPFIEGCGSFKEEWHSRNYTDVLSKIKGHEDKVVMLQGFSYKVFTEIPDNSLGMVYLDGDHTKCGVKLDLACYYPKLVEGGIMCGHDYLNENYGVKEAVSEFAEGLEVHTLEENGDINNMGFWFQKK